MRQPQALEHERRFAGEFRESFTSESFAFATFGSRDAMGVGEFRIRQLASRLVILLRLPA